MSAAIPKHRRRIIIGILVLIVAVVLLIPPLVAGGFTVRVSTVAFKSITGSLGYSVPISSNSIMTAYQYYLTIRGGGVVRTDEGNTSTSRGTANVTMSLMLMNPSNQTFDLGSYHFSGGIGTRSHTVYLSFEQGLRSPGTYVLTVTLTADVAPAGGPLQLGLSTNFTLHWTVS
jgi:hypothetical protein